MYGTVLNQLKHVSTYLVLQGLCSLQFMLIHRDFSSLVKMQCSISLVQGLAG